MKSSYTMLRVFQAMFYSSAVNTLWCLDFVMGADESFTESLAIVLITSTVQVFITLFGCMAGMLFLEIVRIIFIKAHDKTPLFHKLLPVPMLLIVTPLYILNWHTTAIGELDAILKAIVLCAWSASIISTWYFAKIYDHEPTV